MSCTARYHDTVSAYVKHRCRCLSACYAHSQYRAARRAGTAAPTSVPAIATIRRIRGLYEMGHDADTIAAAAEITPRTVQVLAGAVQAGRRDPLPESVRHTTADAIAAATDHLVRLPGRSTVARARAHRAGWAPLRAWADPFDIDDPNADEEIAARTVGMHPSLRRAVLAEARAERARLAELAAISAATLARNRATRWTPTPTEERTSA